MLIEELIEKAFCEGYEYAQKEYARKDYEGLTKRQKEELRKRRRDYAIGLNKVRNSFNKRMDDFDWDRTDNMQTNTEIHGGGIKSTISTESDKGVETGAAFRRRHIKSHRGEILKQAENASNLMREDVEKEIKPGIAHKEQKKHKWISNRSENAKGNVVSDFKKRQRDREIRNDGQFDKHYYDLKLKDTKFRDNDELNKKLETLRKEKELFKATAKERLENIKKIRTKKNLKNAGLVGAGILGAGVAAYASKKAYDRYKAKKQKEQEEKENKKERD